MPGVPQFQSISQGARGGSPARISVSLRCAREVQQLVAGHLSEGRDSVGAEPTELGSVEEDQGCRTGIQRWLVISPAVRTSRRRILERGVSSLSVCRQQATFNPSIESVEALSYCGGRFSIHLRQPAAFSRRSAADAEPSAASLSAKSGGGVTAIRVP